MILYCCFLPNNTNKLCNSYLIDVYPYTNILFSQCNEVSKSKIKYLALFYDKLQLNANTETSVGVWFI